ncbi:hypothetical protein PPTG_23312 [Phytophthora nicotianae INRA-310]|uniref:Uncharacterized protein n=1 Tax=Phytophthora nicotianae (strain INRA-310) TaxID=761204 RepID=W2Q2J8_PHYN3|nr:hypothetical protein PPTG_23312 [Phytophthora nicotianae INRA-310]ETN06510.1 hypothetical protein PPTG_23312 [Phytophthora nicotianae INRA-310]
MCSQSYHTGEVLGSNFEMQFMPPHWQRNNKRLDSRYRNVSSLKGGMSSFANIPKRDVFAHSSSYSLQFGLPEWLMKRLSLPHLAASMYMSWGPSQLAFALSSTW